MSAAPIGWDGLRRALQARPARRIADPAAARAAVALILRHVEAGTQQRAEILFVRRAEHPRDPWSGQMAFPGGRFEPGDQDLEATAVRETAEETGLDLARFGELLGALDEVRAMARMRPLNLTIQPFVFRLEGPGELCPSSEVAAAYWLDLAALLDPAAQGVLDYPWEDATLQLPCLRVRDLIIWGLTYRMFMGLSERLASGGPSSLPPT